MNPIVLLSIALALVGGVCVAFQTPTNAVLARGLNSPINAAFVSSRSAPPRSLWQLLRWAFVRPPLQ